MAVTDVEPAVPAGQPAPRPTQPRPPEEHLDLHLQQGNAATARWYIRAFRIFVRALFLFFFRVRVKGLRNVPKTPVIVCANHMGWSETFLVMLFFPVEPRVYVLGEQQVKDISSFRHWVIDKLEIMVMLDRTKPVQALRIMEGQLKRGGSLLIFPEGHLGTHEGDIQELQPGAAHASQVTGAPLLPVGITGSSDLWFRRTLTMRIGKPIQPAEFEGSLRTRVNSMTARLDKEMRALLPGDKTHPRFKPLRKWLTNLL